MLPSLKNSQQVNGKQCSCRDAGKMGKVLEVAGTSPPSISIPAFPSPFLQDQEKAV